MVNQLSREVDGQYYLCFTLRQAMTSCFAISPVVATLKLHVIFFPTVLHTGWNWLIVVQLKNGFVVAVRLSSDRSKTTSKYGTNKKVAHEAQVSV